MNQCYKIVLAYDGTDFCGWEKQSQGERTLQGVLEESLERLTGRRIPVAGSGRTDSGVHALGQAASFHLDRDFEERRGKGCAGCAGTGYRGRTAIAELMVVDNALREAILNRSSVRELKHVARAGGMRDLQHAGLEKVRAGETNLEELARVLVPDEV